MILYMYCFRVSAVTKMYDYVFPENGLVAYHNGELFNKMVRERERERERERVVDIKQC